MLQGEFRMRKYALPLIAAAAFATAIGASAARAQNLNIATAGPMTGEYAAFGDQMRHGAQKAVQDINAKGGVLGKNLTISRVPSPAPGSPSTSRARTSP